MAYATIDDVKRILRILEPSTTNQYKVRLSDSHTLPESFSTNIGDILLKEISSIDTGYAGSEFWVIKFSSATEFTLYRDESLLVADGNGSVSSNFTSISGIIKINSDEWIGTAQENDKIKFRTDSQMSEDDATSFINDAKVLIKGMISQFIDPDDLPTKTPDLLKTASAYFASNFIFQSVYSNLNADQVPVIVRRWYNFARDLVNMYIESISGNKLFKYKKYARFVARKSIFDTVGITEASGIEGMSGEIDAVDVEYDKDHNSKESLGSS